MPSVIDNITLYQEFQHKNETLFYPAVERIRENLSDAEYQKLKSVPEKIESYISFMSRIDEALDTDVLFNPEVQRMIVLLETPFDYENFDLFSEEEELRKIVMKIKTNSLEPGEAKDPSDSNIFDIYKAFSTQEKTQELSRLFQNGIAWGDAKEVLYEELSSFLKPFKAEYNKIIEDKAYVETTLIEGSEKALSVSEPIIEEVRQAIGIKGF